MEFDEDSDGTLKGVGGIVYLFDIHEQMLPSLQVQAIDTQSTAN